jgi:hypothetical protein
MPFARGDMRDHIVSHKNDHEASYGHYAVLQWWIQLKISFCPQAPRVRRFLPHGFCGSWFFY